MDQSSIKLVSPKTWTVIDRYGADAIQNLYIDWDVTHRSLYLIAIL